MASDEKSVSEEFPELFHYTNVSAFENIFKTRQFWPTHYQDLGDVTEFTRFQLKVQKFISPIIRDIFNRQIQHNSEFAAGVSRHGGIDAVVKKEAEDLLNKIHSQTFAKEMYKETFICSFCAHIQPDEARDGLLSQWRGYGAGEGVAIVLDTSKVEKMLVREHNRFQINNIVTLANVIYDNDSNDLIIKQRFKNVFKYLPKILEEVFPEKGLSDTDTLRSCFEAIHDHFLLGSIRVKHNGFHEENEIRIVVPTTTKDSYSYNPNDPKPLKETRYRQKDNCEARYIKLFGYKPLPIKRIIVGPSRMQNFNCQRIEGIVKTSIKVVKSEIPFSG